MTQAVHPLVHQFGTVAEAYELGRPGYAAEAVDAVVEFLGLGPGRRVLDLAAGTGKLTRQLVASGASIVAVEPMEGMRRAFAIAVPEAELLDGTAEAIPLANGSVDGAVVAQAFHWFDIAPALSELHRVIAPGGGFTIVVNKRDESVPWVARMTELLEEATGGESPVETIDWRERLPLFALFEAFDELEFKHVHRLPRAGVIARVTSISTVAALEAPAKEELVRRIEAMLDGDPLTRGDEVDFPYTTFVLPFRRRSPVPGTDGVVAAVNLNDGGVPKLAVERARIGRLGLDGDKHHDTVHHGGERAAVCLYPQEAIERVRADGHQAFPGSYGENLTLLGLDWAALDAGDRLAIGAGEDGPLLELTQYATPCETQARWFVGGRIGRISHAAYPEDARFYARVLRDGDVAPGMPVRVVHAQSQENSR
jgi:MOSC domain-containing protein YiiM/ubiquinone/menaquinone biosynthesis C-methylase UbiE